MQMNLDKLNDTDFGELEKVTNALLSKPLPQKIHFYNLLVDENPKSLFYQTFIELNCIC